ncbi:MAG: PD-(D/E)XK nuclease family transposase [Saprospiraceae bacterium]
MAIKEKYINPFTDFGFKKLFEAAEIAKFTPEEKEQYEDSLKIYRDLKNVIDTAFFEGRMEGRMEGEKEGGIKEKRPTSSEP